MTKKELKAAQATFHAFIKSQQKPEIETNITFMDGEEERVIPVKIKQKLALEEQINFVHRVVNFCIGTDGVIYPSNFDLGFDLALMEYFTDLKERIKDEDIMDFLACFNVEKFIYDACDGYFEPLRLHHMCKAELEWEQEQYLNAQGVNGVFVKLNAFIDKLDANMNSMGGYMNSEKVEELLNAVKTVAEAPEKVSAKVIEMEHARVAAIKDKQEF